LFPCCSLIENGVLIDTLDLNHGIKYDEHTQLVSFPPAALSKQLADALSAVGRFFPFGHSPTVAAGGFLLAGGQGWFMRGWGCTSDWWVVEMEIVTADGDVVRASETENKDLFWAARGSGQGFFGVVTRIWGKTIPMRKLWETVAVVDCTHRFAEILGALLEITDRTPKDGVEVAFATFRPDRDESGRGEEVQDERVFIAASALAFANTLAEAAPLLKPWSNLPDIPKHYQVMVAPLAERSWNEVFEAQDRLNPAGNGERWQCDSILDHPGVPRKDVNSPPQDI
jgi:FAD/FMN-containing dehydrogenase